jgi:arsenate reductase
VHAALEQTIQELLPLAEKLPGARKAALDEVASFVSSRRAQGDSTDLVFICTHNSRRSQMGQLWAAAAAAHFGIEGVRSHSGGTEVTAFHPRAIAAVQRAGFSLRNPGGENPHYRISFDEGAAPLVCFSKTYDDASNPSEGFVAIMTCSEAEEACPVVFGAALRAPIRHEDPKVSDGTPEESATYHERFRQIGAEMLYLFSRVD